MLISTEQIPDIGKYTFWPFFEYFKGCSQPSKAVVSQSLAISCPQCSFYVGFKFLQNDTPMTKQNACGYSLVFLGNIDFEVLFGLGLLEIDPQTIC